VFAGVLVGVIAFHQFLRTTLAGLRIARLAAGAGFGIFATTAMTTPATTATTATRPLFAGPFCAAILRRAGPIAGRPFGDKFFFLRIACNVAVGFVRLFNVAERVISTELGQLRALLLNRRFAIRPAGIELPAGPATSTAATLAASAALTLSASAAFSLPATALTAAALAATTTTLSAATLGAAAALAATALSAAATFATTSAASATATTTRSAAMIEVFADCARIAWQQFAATRRRIIDAFKIFVVLFVIRIAIGIAAGVTLGRPLRDRSATRGISSLRTIATLRFATGRLATRGRRAFAFRLRFSFVGHLARCIGDFAAGAFDRCRQRARHVGRAAFHSFFALFHRVFSVVEVKTIFFLVFIAAARRSR